MQLTHPICKLKRQITKEGRDYSKMQKKVLRVSVRPCCPPHSSPPFEDPIRLRPKIWKKTKFPISRHFYISVIFKPVGSKRSSSWRRLGRGWWTPCRRAGSSDGCAGPWCPARRKEKPFSMIRRNDFCLVLCAVAEGLTGNGAKLGSSPAGSGQSTISFPILKLNWVQAWSHILWSLWRLSWFPNHTFIQFLLKNPFKWP